MASAQQTLWPAEPHTLTKIDILKGYLNAYFPILGRTKRGQEILLVDGFAGPGEYTNASEGSPIVALRTATAALSRLAGAWVAGDDRLHDASDVGTDPAYAQRTKNKRYRTTPMRGLATHAPYFHDGSAATLADVVNHYDSHMQLGLTAAQKSDLVEFLKSL